MFLGPKDSAVKLNYCLATYVGRPIKALLECLCTEVSMQDKNVDAVKNTLGVSPVEPDGVSYVGLELQISHI